MDSIRAKAMIRKDEVTDKGIKFYLKSGHTISKHNLTDKDLSDILKQNNKLTNDDWIFIKETFGTCVIKIGEIQYFRIGKSLYI